MYKVLNLVVFCLMDSRQILIRVTITSVIHRSDVKRLTEKKYFIMAVARCYFEDFSVFSITTNLGIILQMVRDADSILT